MTRKGKQLHSTERGSDAVYNSAFWSARSQSGGGGAGWSAVFGPSRGARGFVTSSEAGRFSAADSVSQGDGTGAAPRSEGRWSMGGGRGG